MKRIGWFVAPLLVLAVSAGTAVAGGKNCSAANTQECLDYMSKTYKNRGWIGVEIDDTAGSMKITRVIPKSPAEEAGLASGDVLFAVSGVEYAEANKEALTAIREKMIPGETFTFTIKRGEEKKEMAIKLAPMPEEVMSANVGKHLLEAHLTSEKVAEAK